MTKDAKLVKEFLLGECKLYCGSKIAIIKNINIDDISSNMECSATISVVDVARGVDAAILEIKEKGKK